MVVCMDENKSFYDLYGYQFSPIELNNWMLYQQPYLNFPSYDIFSGNIGINYGQLSLPNNYDPSFSSNIPQGNFHSNIPFNPTCLTDLESSSYGHNINSNEMFKKSTKSPRFHNESNSQKNNQIKTVKNENHYKLSTSKPFEILNRNKKGDDEKFRKAFNNNPKIDLENDFPPISTTSQTERILECDKTLDYRLALQKPKPIQLDTTKKENNTDLQANEEKPKKKRKRNRKKKPVEKPAQPFAYVDEEFPSLNVVQVELKEIDAIKTETVKDSIRINKTPNTTSEKKKSKKRQLLFILPGDLDGQVRVIQAPTIQKNKIKRKSIQDRIKRPIGMLNPLDLTAPFIKRGKERLKPKVKHPSKLKKTILLYRNLKKEIREKANMESATTCNDVEKIDNVQCAAITLPEKKSENPTNRMHSKIFREYCNHMVDNKINSIITQLLKTLIGFQDKLHNRDPVKAKMKRRLCFGLREVTKFVHMKRLRLIIIAPDLEKIDIEGGLDDIVGLIIKGARESGIPYVFGLSRSSLAYLCYKKFRVGAIGIFNYDGAETHVKDLLTSVDQAREQYNQVKQIMESIVQDVSTLSTSLNISTPFSSNVKYEPLHNNANVPYNAGHSRTPSNALSEPISDVGDMNKLLFNSIMEDQIKNANSEESEREESPLNEDIEGFTKDKLIDEYVDNILHSVSRLHLSDENL